MRGFKTLRDWMLWQKERGHRHFLKVNSPNPYIRRLMRYALRFGWDFPFAVATGKASREDKKMLLDEWEQKQEYKKRCLQAELTLITNKRLKSSHIGPALSAEWSSPISAKAGCPVKQKSRIT